MKGYGCYVILPPIYLEKFIKFISGFEWKAHLDNLLLKAMNHTAQVNRKGKGGRAEGGGKGENPCNSIVLKLTAIYTYWELSSKIYT